MVTVGTQITEGRAAHTGSAFLFSAVTAPTNVCLNWGFDTWRDYFSQISPPSPSLLSSLYPEDRPGH